MVGTSIISILKEKEIETSLVSCLGLHGKYLVE